MRPQEPVKSDNMLTHGLYSESRRYPMFTRIGERGQKIEIEGAGFNVVVLSYSMGERPAVFWSTSKRRIYQGSSN